MTLDSSAARRAGPSARSVRVVLAAILLVLAAPSAVRAAEIIGRVLEVRGAVYGQAPGEARRILECNDPVFEGDRILTQDASEIALDVGGLYAGLGPKSRLVVGARGGEPRVDLERGHLRAIDSGAAESRSARLTTPGLRLAGTPDDVEALAFPGKAGVVSLVCAFDDPIQVERRRGPDALGAAPGSCVVEKPREPLYTAPATHPQLEVMASLACGELPEVRVADRFDPASVGLGLEVLGGGPGTPDPKPLLETLCTSGTTCAGKPVGTPTPPGPPRLPTQFPFVPPVLP